MGGPRYQYKPIQVDTIRTEIKKGKVTAGDLKRKYPDVFDEIKTSTLANKINAIRKETEGEKTAPNSKRKLIIE
jgi:hypothetical protein